MEAVLNCTKLLNTQAQYETAFTGEFGSLIQLALMNSLHFNSISVIDTARVTKSPTVPHRDKPVAGLSIIGKETLRWAQLISEHRFCSNDYEVVSVVPVVKIHHDMITSQLGIRTIRSQHMSADKSSQSLIHYVETYADFGMQYT